MIPAPIHPFPARMAPEIALSQCSRLVPGSIVLDPMAGSGTVLRVATDQRLMALGFDTDPLAVLMAQVWTQPLSPADLRTAARDLVGEATTRFNEVPALGWIDNDLETARFVDFWFGPQQQGDLRRLSAMLIDRAGPVTDALRIALSRIIVTKDRGASLGRDVSHSRPHRAFIQNDFSVMIEFVRSADRLARRLETQPPPGNAIVSTGDARKLDTVGDQSIDAVITSPPYLNALDYIRGHRLSLVWLGHQVGNLRTVRADSIGSERAPSTKSPLSARDALASIVETQNDLPVRECRMIERYIMDLYALASEVRRTLRSGGTATFVIGNSCLRGVFVDNASAVILAAEKAGLALNSRVDRELPPSRRYLPPPGETNQSNLTKRMRSEVVLDFVG